MLLNHLLMSAFVRAPETGTGTAAPDAAADTAAPAAAAPAEAATPAAETAAPAAEAPAAKPAGEAAPSDNAASDGKTDAAPDAKTESKSSTPSLLELAKGKDKAPEKDATAETEEKPATTDDTKKADGEKKPAAEGDKKDVPAKEALADKPPATYEAFKTPEGVTFDEKELKAFTDLIGPAQLPQEAAQSLVDLHLKDIQRVFEQVAQNQHDTWNKLNDGWKTETRKDEKLGGNRLETSLSNSKAVIEMFARTPQEAAELIAHTSNNGMGNYLPFIGMLNKLGEILNVFEDGIVPSTPTAPNANRGPGNRGWYNNSQGNGGAAA